MMSVNFKDKYLKYKKKYLALCNTLFNSMINSMENEYFDLDMYGGSAAGRENPQNFSSKLPVFGENTASIYISVSIDINSDVARFIKCETAFSFMSLMKKEQCFPVSDKTFHITLFEFIFDSSTPYGKLIIGDFISGRNRIKNVINKSFGDSLKNKLLPTEGYDVFSIFLVKKYGYDKEVYEEFKRLICTGILEIFDLNKTCEILHNEQNITTEGIKWEPKTIESAPSASAFVMSKKYYYFDCVEKAEEKVVGAEEVEEIEAEVEKIEKVAEVEKIKLKYAIDENFFMDKWKPHISLMKFTKPPQIDVQKEFNALDSRLGMFGTKEKIKLGEKQIAGSVSNLSIILNYPDCPMNRYKIDIKL